MSSASRGSITRRRMKLRNRDCSRTTTSEIRWSCSSAICSRLAMPFTYRCRRMSGYGYCRERHFEESAGPRSCKPQRPTYGSVCILGVSEDGLMKPKAAPIFNPKVFLAKVGKGRTLAEYKKSQRSEERRVGKE